MEEEMTVQDWMLDEDYDDEGNLDVDVYPIPPGLLQSETLAIRVDARQLEGLTKARGHKYRRRWKGRDGRWNYEYDRPKGRGRKRGGRQVELSKESLAALLAHGNYSIISAGKNPNDRKEAKIPGDHSMFTDRHEKLKADVARLGLNYTEVEGHYGGKETSILVFHGGKKPRKGAGSLIVHHTKGASEYEKVRALGERYNQDSVIHSRSGTHEMHFTTGDQKGTHYKGEGHVLLPEATDFFTVAGTPATKFSLNFDFDATHGASDALLKAKYISRKKVKGKWQYTYAKPKKGKKTPAPPKRKRRRKVTDDASYERHLEELAPQAGFGISDSTTGHKPGGGAITTSAFYVNTTPMGLKRVLGNKPNKAKVEAVVAAVAKEAGKAYGEKPADLVEEMRENAARMGFRASPEIKLLDQALAMLANATEGQYQNDDRQGEVRVLEILVEHFPKVKKSEFGLPADLFKAKPRGRGWQIIPKGKKGGYRKWTGKGWDYWYPAPNQPGKKVKAKSPKVMKKKRGKKPPPAKKREAKSRKQVRVGEAEIPADWKTTQTTPQSPPKPEPGHELPAGKSRKAPVYKRSRAEKGTILWNVENGAYMLKQYQPRHAKRMRLRIEIPGDPNDPTSDKSKFVREMQNVLHHGIRQVGKPWGVPLSPKHPDYQELTQAANVGLLMAIGNYRGGRAFVPFAEDYAKAYAFQAVRQMRTAVSIPDSKMQILGGYASAKSRARTLARERNEEDPTAAQIAKTWYLTKRMVWTGRPETLGRYSAGVPLGIVDQAHEQVPDAERWQVKGPTGKPLGRSFPSKIELVPMMEQMLAGDKNIMDDAWMAVHEHDLLPDHTGAALPAGTVLHLREEIRDIASGMNTGTKPYGDVIMMRMGLYEAIEEDPVRMAQLKTPAVKALAKKNGLATTGSKSAIIAKIAKWASTQDRPGTGGRSATALEIADALHLFVKGKKGKTKGEASRKAAMRRMVKQSWAQLWDKAQQDKSYVAQFMSEWKVRETVAEEKPEPGRLHAPWFPSHQEFKDRFGTDERVYVYQAAIRAGIAGRAGEILDAEKRGEASDTESQWLRAQYHEQRHRDATAQFQRYKAITIDPSESQEWGPSTGTPGESDWLFTEAVISDYMRAKLAEKS